MMAKFQQKLTKIDFDRCNWQDVIETIAVKECPSYYMAFLFKATEAETKNDEKAKEVFALLGAITSLQLNLDSPRVFEPLHPIPHVNSFLLDDLSDDNLTVLADIVDTTADAEMRARIADVLWVRGRSRYFSKVEIAVNAYLEAGSNVMRTSKYYLDGITRIGRALQLAASTHQKELLSDVINYIEQELTKLSSNDETFLSARLMELLLQYGAGDSTKYAALAGHLASLAESVSDWHRARAYWEVKASWHGKEENVDEKNKALIKVAETHVKLAEISADLATPHYPSACFQLQRAIEAYRRLGGMRSRIDELHRMLLTYQEESMKDMKSAQFSENITEIVENARETIKHKSLNEAIITLARSLASPKVVDLRRQIDCSAVKKLDRIKPSLRECSGLQAPPPQTPPV